MNPQEMINIKNSITELTESVSGVRKMIKGFMLNSKRSLKANAEIPPGIACKIGYDANGLILQGSPLTIEDIPELPLDKINGLQKLLERKLEDGDLKSLREVTSPRKKIKAGTGTKINYDDDGLVTSSADLLPDDIPIIPVDKISGLNDRLELLESKELAELPTIPSINPGTFCKITYDKDGRVVSGSRLSIDDIPIEVINRLNLIETRIPDLVTRDVISSINAGVKRMSDMVSEVHRIIVEIKPQEISIQSIPNLDSTLRKKADQKDLVELTNTVTSLLDSTRTVHMHNIESQLTNKADLSELRNLTNQVEVSQRIIDSLSERLPTEHLGAEVQRLRESIDTLIGRVSTIEQKLNIDSAFCKL